KPRCTSRASTTPSVTSSAWPPMTADARPPSFPRRAVVAITMVVAALVLVIPAYVLVLIPLTPSVDGVLKGRAEKPSVLLAADGSVLTQFRRTNREWVKLEQVPKHVIDALITTEDHRFWEHHGVDWVRTISAMGHTLVGGRQGGSTI